MTSPLSDSELDHLLNFVGYGRLDADVWFMGMEEAGGGCLDQRSGKVAFPSVREAGRNLLP